MGSNSPQERQQAHAYFDRLPDAQVAAVRGLPKAMLDPGSRALAMEQVRNHAQEEEKDPAA